MQFPDADYGLIGCVAIVAQKMPLSQVVFVVQEASAQAPHHAFSAVF
jgi:hypothetical protein